MLPAAAAAAAAARSESPAPPPPATMAENASDEDEVDDAGVTEGETRLVEDPEALGAAEAEEERLPLRLMLVDMATACDSACCAAWRRLSAIAALSWSRRSCSCCRNAFAAASCAAALQAAPTAAGTTAEAATAEQDARAKDTKE